MKRSLIFIFFVTSFYQGTAQLILKNIISNTPTSNARLNDTSIVGKLPFWDDFSQSQTSVDSLIIFGNDTIYLWDKKESTVYVNATLAINPPSYKVATFDGLGIDGNTQDQAFDYGLSDKLTSNFIDLEDKTVSNEVKLSFYWQAGGEVEIPDENDSLRLQFFRSDSVWVSVWKKSGEDITQDSVFAQENITLTDDFLWSCFRFRFQSFGQLNGPFDAWHIDWVYLDENRGNDNFFYVDRGLSGELSSPFFPFVSIPAAQFKESGQIWGSQSINVFNLDEFLQPAEYVLVLKDKINDVIIDSLGFGSISPIRPNPNAFFLTAKRTLEFDSLNMSSIPVEDSLVIESKVYLDNSSDGLLNNTNIDLKINDSVRKEYLLKDYFAFDDGTAEYAIGTNIKNGQFAVKFWTITPDTLTHISINFPKIHPISQGKVLQLRILKRLNEETPLFSGQITIETNEGIDGFTSYKLAIPVIITDTFYISLQQFVNEYIGIGFDKNNVQGTDKIFENSLGEWRQNTRLVGSIMIRPHFSKVDRTIVLGEPPSASEVHVSPNPTTGMIKVTGIYDTLEVLNTLGQRMRIEPTKEVHDLSGLKNGLYILLIHQNGKIIYQKIIVRQ